MATSAAPGIVSNQVTAISRAFAQRTALARSEAPIPIIDEETT